MDYLKKYYFIINEAKSENRVKHNGIYYENHHIIPKCMDGTNDEKNLVLLTAKEHYICHKLLVKIYPGRKMACAFHKMTFSKHKKVSLRDYAYARELIASTPISIETKQKLSKDGKNRVYKKHSEETKKKIGLKSKGRTHKCSEETKELMRKNNIGQNNPMYGKEGWKKGKHLSDEEKKYLSNLYLGKTYEEIHGIEKSIDIKNKLSQSLKGKNKGQKRKQETKNKISKKACERYKYKEAKSKTKETTKLAMQRPEVKENMRLGMIKRKENKLKREMELAMEIHTASLQ